MRPVTWNRAVRALIVAGLLVLAVLIVAENFVLVEVRLLGLSFEVRLAWAVVVPAALTFAGGLLYARARSADPSAASPDEDPPSERAVAAGRE
jgi:type VI protein secretion system component VasK